MGSLSGGACYIRRRRRNKTLILVCTYVELALTGEDTGAPQDRWHNISGKRPSRVSRSSRSNSRTRKNMLAHTNHWWPEQYIRQAKKQTKLNYSSSSLPAFTGSYRLIVAFFCASWVSLRHVLALMNPAARADWPSQVALESVGHSRCPLAVGSHAFSHLWLLLSESCYVVVNLSQQ